MHSCAGCSGSLDTNLLVEKTDYTSILASLGAPYIRRFMPPSILLAFEHFFAMWVLNFRSDWMMTPRYLMQSVQSRGEFPRVYVVLVDLLPKHIAWHFLSLKGISHSLNHSRTALMFSWNFRASAEFLTVWYNNGHQHRSLHCRRDCPQCHLCSIRTVLVLAQNPVGFFYIYYYNFVVCWRLLSNDWYYY